MVSQRLIGLLKSLFLGERRNLLKSFEQLTRDHCYQSPVDWIHWTEFIEFNSMNKESEIFSLNTRRWFASATVVDKPSGLVGGAYWSASWLMKCKTIDLEHDPRLLILFAARTVEWARGGRQRVHTFQEHLKEHAEILFADRF